MAMKDAIIQYAMLNNQRHLIAKHFKTTILVVNTVTNEIIWSSGYSQTDRKIIQKIINSLDLNYTVTHTYTNRDLKDPKRKEPFQKRKDQMIVIAQEGKVLQFGDQPIFDELKEAIPMSLLDN